MQRGVFFGAMADILTRDHENDVFRDVRGVVGDALRLREIRMRSMPR